MNSPRLMRRRLRCRIPPLRLFLAALSLLPLVLRPRSAEASKLNPRLRVLRGDAARRVAAAGGLAPEPAYRVLLEASPGTGIDALRAAYPTVLFRAAAGTIFTAVVPESALDALDADPRVLRIEASLRLHPTLDVARSNATSGGLYLGVTRNAASTDLANATGAGVIVGIIDTGIDYKHKDFIVPGTATSRIRYLWDQTDTGGPAPSVPGFSCTNSGGVNDCGSEWTQSQLSAGSAREVDTDGHGTHVAGIAAGNGQAGSFPGTYVGVARQADIIFVKTDFTSIGVIDAIKYVAARAAQLGEPAVVNLSLGAQIDPHDGTSAFDVAVANLAANTPVVAATGNDGTGASVFPHAQAAGLSNGQAVTFSITATSPAGKDAEADFWTGSPTSASNSAFTAAVSVNGTSCGSKSNGSGTDTATTSNPISCAGQSVYIDNNNGQEGLNGAGTASSNDREIYVDVRNPGGLPSGLTISVTLTCTNASGCGQVDGFVDPAGEGSDFAAGTGYTRPSTLTLGTPATANNVITVGSYAAKKSWTAANGLSYTYDTSTLGNISTFSGWGPTRDGRQKPDVAAPGDVVASAYSEQVSLPCSGCSFSNTTAFDQLLPDGAHAILAGTSMATPIVTGILATRLQGAPSRAVGDLRTLLQHLARSDAAVTGQGATPNPAFGYGKVTASPQPIDAPTGLSGSPLGVSSITWSWNNTVIGADAYDLYPGGGPTNVKAVQPPYALTGLSPNTVYSMQVAGEGAGLEGPLGASASAATLANPVNAISYGSQINSITATFSPLPSSPPSASCSGYVLQAAVSPDFSGTVFSSQTAAGAASSLTIPGLPSNTQFYVRLGTLNPLGGVNYSPASLVTTFASLPTASAPSNIAAASIQANFGPGANGAGLRYIVDASPSPDFTGTLVTSQTLNYSAILGPLLPNTTYFMRVAAANAVGSQTSPVALPTAVTLANPPTMGSPPYQFVAFSSFSAQWTPLPASPQAATAEGYELDASAAADFSGTVFRAFASGSAASALTVSGLASFTQYYVRVGALNWAGAPNYIYFGSLLTLLTLNSTQTVPPSGNLSVLVTPASPQVLEVNVQVPAGAFPPGTSINVNSSVASIPAPGSGQSNLVPLGGSAGFDISAGGLQPLTPVTISVTYNPATLPAGISAGELAMYSYDASAGVWSSLLNNAVDANAHTVTAATPHFTLFAPFAVLGGAASVVQDFSGLQIFPIPWKPGFGDSFDAPALTLQNLPSAATAKFYTIHGEKVYDATASAAGVILWPGTDAGGRKVASGTYLVLIQSGAAKTVRRVVVVR